MTRRFAFDCGRKSQFGDGGSLTDELANSFPRIAAAKRTRLSEWVTLVENSVATTANDAGAVYHSFESADYVSILALTVDRRVPLVSQFRPAVNRTTVEFPGGMLDVGESPERCAIRELAEEAGLQVTNVVPLAVFLPDSGRLNNRMWSYFAADAVPIAGWRPERGVTPMSVTLDDLFARACDGSFDHGPHLAMLGMALVRGLVRPPDEVTVPVGGSPVGVTT